MVLPFLTYLQRFINEVDAIRDVLLSLQGFSTPLIQFSGDLNGKATCAVVMRNSPFSLAGAHINTGPASYPTCSSSQPTILSIPSLLSCERGNAATTNAASNPVDIRYPTQPSSRV